MSGLAPTTVVLNVASIFAYGPRPCENVLFPVIRAVGFPALAGTSNEALC